jgi:hypothetical protein
MQALQGLQLRRYAGGESTDSNVPDVSEKVFNADLLSFFCFDYGRSMYEGLGGCGTILRKKSF